MTLQALIMQTALEATLIVIVAIIIVVILYAIIKKVRNGLGGRTIGKIELTTVRLYLDPEPDNKELDLVIKYLESLKSQEKK